MSKVHSLNPKTKGPRCGVLPGYYQPIKLTQDANEITCVRCKAMAKRAE